MSELDTLATELLFHVVSFLECKDVAALSQTCKRLYAIARHELVWQRLCKIDYNLTSLTGWGENVTFYEVYAKVLHRYGKCLGLWRNSEIPYGLFVHVKIEPGRLTARLCQYPLTSFFTTHDVRAPLEWFSPLFTVMLKDGEGRLTCRKLCPPPSQQLQIKDGNLHFSCDQCRQWAESVSAAQMCSNWVAESRPDHSMVYSVSFKEDMVAKLTKSWSGYEMQRILPPIQSSVSPITLGLYKGTYGGHGIEVINLTLADNGYHLLGDKILGDPNVPAGELSIYADLRQPLTLTLEQQDFSYVSSMEPETLEEPFRFPPDASQPFSLNPDIIVRDMQELPKACKARYGGKGRIAEHGYRNPDYCRGQLVVFSEDYFGFYWIDLRSFSVYRLVDDDFS